MKKDSKIIKWFKSESPIIQLTIMCSIGIMIYAILTSKSPDGLNYKTKIAEVYSEDCDWSLDKDYFHTEGNFHNGTLWQISSRDGDFFKLTFGNGVNKTEKLKNYQEAKALSEYYISKGYGCKNYTF